MWIWIRPSLARGWNGPISALRNMLILQAAQKVLHSLLEAAQAASSSQSLSAEIAESQEMLVQKICKESLFIAAGIAVDKARQNLKTAEELYESSHTTLVLGLEAANIPRLRNMCTMHAMRDVTHYYQQLRQNVRVIINACTLEESIRVAQSFRGEMFFGGRPSLRGHFRGCGPFCSRRKPVRSPCHNHPPGIWCTVE